MTLPKQQYATSRTSLAGAQLLTHLGERGHVMNWLSSAQHHSGGTASRYIVLFPSLHDRMKGRLLRIFPENPHLADDLHMIEEALVFPWIHTGMRLVAFNAVKVSPTGLFADDVWVRMRHALDQLCGYKAPSSFQRRLRGGHNENRFPRYALG